jgi:hypothetical protein
LQIADRFAALQKSNVADTLVSLTRQNMKTDTGLPSVEELSAIAQAQGDYLGHRFL